MARKPLHPLRRKFRKFLYCLLAVSFLFAGSMAYLRMNYHLVRDNPQFREVIFKAHITQMSIASYFQTDEEQLNAAIKMANSSLFSQSYWVSGNKKIKQLTDEGYAPAQVVYADMLIHHNNSVAARARAHQYYQLAAAQNYQPAIDKLSILQLANTR